MVSPRANRVLQQKKCGYGRMPSRWPPPIPAIFSVAFRGYSSKALNFLNATTYDMFEFLFNSFI